jgi:hypothetical protein
VVCDVSIDGSLQIDDADKGAVYFGDAFVVDKTEFRLMKWFVLKSLKTF